MPRVPTFVTDRLVLRPPSPGDLADIVALGGDPEVMHFVGKGRTQLPVQATYWLEIMLLEARHGSPNPAAPAGMPGASVIIERETQEFVGLTVLRLLPPDQVAAIGAEDCPTPCLEVGYILARAFWGRGIAFEAATPLVRYAFEKLELPTLVAIADVKNTASNKILAKLGFQHKKVYVSNNIEMNYWTMERN
ncbi:GNAT family N-acetyltransferase [Fimbriimonas ginsengisoli]|uniref:GCN5-related N-acetyltransferase n=1 Tax=Fimbriimonas ginsengisoli Gsoil 348 TaxID=661478 RepID=A0A068NRN7_FIMGI|nr:GNAT family N-acetyltransferase [Fimbriimonas ginsengisoli]AIE84279.1 GCN5-related N-acetyltransferase [Fimbriimonas ginsengisoli Gsoil 348]